jgi:hypothetical protein
LVSGEPNEQRLEVEPKVVLGDSGDVVVEAREDIFVLKTYQFWRHSKRDSKFPKFSQTF